MASLIMTKSRHSTNVHVHHITKGLPFNNNDINKTKTNILSITYNKKTSYLGSNFEGAEGEQSLEKKRKREGNKRPSTKIKGH